jgi:hypothetical protein
MVAFQEFAETRGWLLFPFRTPTLPAGPLTDWTDCRNGVLVRAAEVDRVVWKPAKNGTWYADILNAPVIEFGVGHSPEGIPRTESASGRMWFATSYLRDGHTVPADPEFVKAARALLNWPRRHWKLVNSNYVSPGAVAHRDHAG